ncbi:hypothetical protein C8R47DRAFT_1208740 [Mycena vitilis]|nr:hypothetical protein C8R47DRAFT_1208740 [Mycena vitilis]
MSTEKDKEERDGKGRSDSLSRRRSSRRDGHDERERDGHSRHHSSDERHRDRHSDSEDKDKDSKHGHGHTRSYSADPRHEHGSTSRPHSIRSTHSARSDDSKRRREDRDKDRDKDKDKEREEKPHKVASYSPEFLHALAARTASSDAQSDADFDVISGADAVRFTRRFVREQAAEGNPLDAALSAALPDAPPATPAHAHAPPTAASHASHASHASNTSTTIARRDSRTKDHDKQHSDDKRLKRSLQPVVFALPRSAAGDAGRRVVDFYMSWRGKTKTHPLKGRARRAGFLDSEFRRVRDKLDGEWKRARGRECEEEERVLGGVRGARGVFCFFGGALMAPSVECEANSALLEAETRAFLCDESSLTSAVIISVIIRIIRD